MSDKKFFVSVLFLLVFVLIAWTPSPQKVPQDPAPGHSEDVISGSRVSVWVSVKDTHGMPVAVNLSNVRLFWANQADPNVTVIECTSGTSYLLQIKYKDFWELTSVASGSWSTYKARK